MSEVRVECYAGHKADERPVRFFLEGRKYEITAIDDRWYSPDVAWFRALADDGNVYVLKHDEGRDAWELEAYRAVGRAEH
jgi:hypothetical protein